MRRFRRSPKLAFKKSCAGPQRSRRKFDTPVWIDREFTQREGGRKARTRRAVDSWLEIPKGYPGSESPTAMAQEFEEATVARLVAAVDELKGIAVMMGMTCTMEKEKMGSDENGGVGNFSMSLHRYGTLRKFPNPDANMLREFVSYSMAYAIEEFEKFVQNGYGWFITSVEKLDLRIDWYHPGRGGSHMESPAWLVSKKCCVNVRNLNQECFRYALTAAVDRP